MGVVERNTTHTPPQDPDGFNLTNAAGMLAALESYADGVAEVIELVKPHLATRNADYGVLRVLEEFALEARDVAEHTAAICQAFASVEEDRQANLAKREGAEVGS